MARSTSAQQVTVNITDAPFVLQAKTELQGQQPAESTRYVPAGGLAKADVSRLEQILEYLKALTR